MNSADIILKKILEHCKLQGDEKGSENNHVYKFHTNKKNIKDKNSKNQLETLSMLLRKMHETEVCVDDETIKLKLEEAGISIDILKKYCNIMKEAKNNN
ncbi:TPA: hypothetical protein ACXC99_002076 [Clostridium botulinum]